MRTIMDAVDYRAETLKCPYCNAEIDDAWEIDEGDGQSFECPVCEKEFIVSKEFTAVYTTYKKEDENYEN